MFGGVSGVGGGEEGEVPVLGDVPVEGVEGVDEDGKEPGGVSLEISLDGTNVCITFSKG